MFLGSGGGGKTAAMLRSFVASCQRVEVDPFAWFKDILARIADHPLKRLGFSRTTGRLHGLDSTTLEHLWLEPGESCPVW